MFPSLVKNRRRMRLALAGLATCAVTALTSVYGIGRAQRDAQIAEAIPATTQISRPAQRGSFSATGVVKPQVGAEVRVGSQISGIVTQLNVKVGDLVQKDQVLALLDDRSAHAAVALAKAGVQAAAAESGFARTQLLANEQLHGVVSALTLSDLRRNAEVKAAELARAKATLDDAELLNMRTKIVAPIFGTVESVSTYEGETVAASLTAPTFVTIIDLDRLEIQAFIDETDIGKVYIGQPLTFRLEAYPDSMLSGEVVAIQPKAELLNNVVNYVVIVAIHRREGLILRPEMTVRLSFDGREISQVENSVRSAQPREKPDGPK